MPATRSIRAPLTRTFSVDERGAIALTFALTLIPTTALFGAALDYSRASAARTTLQKIADTAAVAGVTERTQDFAVRKRAATTIAEDQLRQIGNRHGTTTIHVSEPAGGQVQVNLTVGIATSFMKIVGLPAMTVNVTSVAEAPADAEIALVLDTTGSMKDDMGALRQTATRFVDTLFHGSSGGDLRMSVVPYVAAVNPGKQILLNTGSMDLNATTSWHSDANFEGSWIGYIPGCTQQPLGAPVIPPVPPPKSERSSLSPSKTYAGLGEILSELFGVKSAAAQSMVNTNSPVATFPHTIYPPHTLSGAPMTIQIPVGFSAGAPLPWTVCLAFNPKHINFFDLFNRIRGASWKGCVQARAGGHDLTDQPPGQGDTLFVPYFWPDEQGKRGEKSTSNSYLDELQGNGPFASNLFWSNVLKYDINSPTDPLIIENQPSTVGPNASCPDEVLPLTSDKSKILNRIGSLIHYFGGGTVSSEGLMWGWRTLSPSKPYGQGKPYGTTRKFIVLMSDGANMISSNVNHDHWMSDFSAYGYRFQGRLNANTLPEAEITLDAKMIAACTNAKAKGITIVTILFRDDSVRAAENLRRCASESGMFFKAGNQATLEAAFQTIAGKVNNLRLTR